jgi:alpha-L-fucosidase 2
MPLLERIYNNARYGLMSGAGYTAPRLNGPGVGEWNLMWRNAYTMDANVNIQVSGINSGNMYEAGVGYIWFVLRQLKDWEINAKKVYGMKNALLAPINTDGQRAMMVEYDINYPFQYWNTGASWMILPIAEWVDCYGDVSITTTDQKIIKQYNKEVFNVKKDILMPLLQKTYNFWEQLCTPEYYTDIEGNARYEKGKTHLFTGEKYLIIPSFSPENKPLGYKSAITANASMDIAAAKDIIAMYIDMENELQNEGYKERIKKAEKLNNELPDYQYDESGAIREWAMKEYQENNAHRHISHLYCAWPAYQTQHNNKLANACRQAILNRNKENSGKDDTASHGWIHKALVEARLKNSEEVYNILNMLVHSDIFYSTLFTDHNTNRAKGVACTDTLYGITGIINEMLVYSDKNTVELLPALSRKIPEGNIGGLLTRAGVRVDYLSWDVDKRNVKADLTALRDTSFNLVLNNKAYIGEENESKCVAVQLKKGEMYCFMG